MFPKRTAGWWYWSFTAGLLAASFAGWHPAIYLAMALTCIQIAHYTYTEGSLADFAVQVRIAYLGLLVAGTWGPLRFVHAIQLIGTTSVVLVGYCPLARVMALMPWNRRVPLSAGLVARIIFSRPVRGSILDHVQGEPSAAPSGRA